jgi:hypothetical protein
MLPISQRQEVTGNGELELATLETGNNPSRPRTAAQENRFTIVVSVANSKKVGLPCL